MMDKIRNRTQPTRLRQKQGETIQGCSSAQHPWLSFCYMTANKSHSLQFLDGLDTTERERTLGGLLFRLEELSRFPWLHWMENRKNIGLETIPFDSLRFAPSQKANLTKDTTLYIFRFDTYQGNGKGRIIGFKRSPCAAYHIIGYDFNFTAYPH